MYNISLKVIGRIVNDFPQKFGLPRQSGRVENLKSKIILEKPYQNIDSLKGIEGFSHIWIIWGFSENEKEDWSATVRPPRLGGNKRMGVFATRSPYRPNPLGLSCVKIESVESDNKWGPVINILGGDMMNGTPVFDIKPYLPTSDCYPEASGGFASDFEDYKLEVNFPENLLNIIPNDKREVLIKILSEDPRPSYQNDEKRIYGFFYSDFEIKFRVTENALTVCDVLEKI